MTNTQHAEVMAELVSISRTLQRIADSCERAEARADLPVPHGEAEREENVLVNTTDIIVPPQPAVQSPAIRKHKGRRS